MGGLRSLLVNWPSIFSKLISRHDLDASEVVAAMSTILDGKATDAQIAAFAVALRAKGETVTEIVSLAQTMRQFGERVVLDPAVVDVDHLLDTCGTGGDRAGTVNISTMAAFVAAGAGVRVAKHGNRAASSVCGSADVLEALGVVIDLGPDGVASCIHQGMGFCFAPRFHPALRFAASARRELGVPTTFNFLGPLTNPAGARRQVIGVSDPTMADRMVRALAELDTQRAWVFYGHDGLDELTTTSTSTVMELRDGTIGTFELDPSSYGFAAAGVDAFAGGDAQHNAAVLRRVLAGEVGEVAAVRDIVVLNAAAAIVVAGFAPSMDDGITEAVAAIDEGRAHQALALLVKTSQAAAQSAEADEG